MLARILPLLALTGCYDFLGDAGRIGFSTDLVVGPGAPWTPTWAVAEGTTARVAAMGVVDRDDQPELRASATGPLDLVEVEPGEVEVRGKGRLMFSGDGVRDGFTLDTRRARDIRAHGLADVMAGDLGGLADSVAMVEGTACELGLSVHDRRGRPLGFQPELATVAGADGVSAWASAGGSTVLATHGEATLELGYLDLHVEGPMVTVVAEEEVAAIRVVTRVITVDEAQQLVLVAAGRTAAGEPLLCAPARWTIDGEPMEADAMPGVALTADEVARLDGAVLSASFAGLEASVSIREEALNAR